MILSKSVFNPNQTYIGKFKGGNFIEATNWMIV